MTSDYLPLIREFMEAVLDTRKAARNPTQRDARRVRADQVRGELREQRKTLEGKLHKASDYFSKHGGWGVSEPSPLPPQWAERNNKYKEWLTDYELVCSALTLGTEYLWSGE